MSAFALEDIFRIMNPALVETKRLAARVAFAKRAVIGLPHIQHGGIEACARSAASFVGPLVPPPPVWTPNRSAPEPSERLC